MTPDTRDHGARLLAELCAMLDRFCVFPSTALRDIVALWIVATHVRDYSQAMVWNALGRLGILALTPNAGKSTALQIVAATSYGDDTTLELNPSPRGMLQAINEERNPTYWDNADRSPAFNGQNNSDAVSIVLGGYKYGARKRILNRKWNLFEAMALSALDANIRNNPKMEDVLSRLIAVHMKRARPDQHVTTWNGRLHDQDAAKLRAALTAWGRRVADDLAMAWPDFPDGVTDGRIVEIWTPLLAVGEACGDEWAERARNGCKAVVLSDAAALDAEPVLSPTDQLLAALAECLRPDDPDVVIKDDGQTGKRPMIPTRVLLARLARSSFRWMAGVPQRPAAIELSARLRQFEVRPEPFWHPEHGSIQGYCVDDVKPLLPTPPTGDLIGTEEDDPDLLPL